MARVTFIDFCLDAVSSGTAKHDNSTTVGNTLFSLAIWTSATTTYDYLKSMSAAYCERCYGKTICSPRNPLVISDCVSARPKRTDQCCTTRSSAGIIARVAFRGYLLDTLFLIILPSSLPRLPLQDGGGGGGGRRERRIIGGAGLYSICVLDSRY